MVLPREIVNAAIDGDSARVLAWLDADVLEEPRDVNDVDENGITLLFSSTGDSYRMSDRHLALARRLIDRGADVNKTCKKGTATTVGLLSYGLLAHNLSHVNHMEEYSGILHDFVLMLLRAGFDPNQSEVLKDNRFSTPLNTALIALKYHPTRHFLKIASVMLRAGASLDSIWNGKSVEVAMQALSGAGPIIWRVGVHQRVEHPYWVAWTELVGEVRAAGGTWTAYRRQSRKDVLRLRSLMLRGRAKDAADPVVARVLRLPNELCWHVLDFWRATSAATGEVI